MVKWINFIDDHSDLYDPYLHQEQMEVSENKTGMIAKADQWIRCNNQVNTIAPFSMRIHT
ncbi:hypothetical protein ABES08_08485 [Peribacillus simplex]|uniref:hypothetical protein n=1 Tax=Peribacillus simplex TaxID=1478 RepID=UPI003D29C23B